MANKVVKEINIVNGIVGSLASGTVAWPASNVGPAVDLTKFNGTISFVFEIEAKNTDSSDRAVTLYINGSSRGSYTVPASTTSYTFFRQTTVTEASGDINILLDQTTNDNELQVKMARLVILQDAGDDALVATETQTEIGDYEQVSTELTWLPLTYPKYWTYTAANWDGTCTFYAEAIAVSDNDMYDFSIRLEEDDGSFGNWGVSNSWLIADTIGSETIARYRSSSFTPTDGRHYRLAWYNSDNMATVTIFCGKVIMEQTAGPVIDEDTASTDAPIYGDGGSSEATGQSFSSGAGYTLGAAGFEIFKTGSPTDGLYVEVAASIDGAAIATSDTINASSLSGSATWHAFNFPSPATLSPSTTYYLRLFRTGSRDTSNYFRYVYDPGANPYPGGIKYTKSSGSWNPASSQDMNFRTYSALPTKHESYFQLINTGIISGTGRQDFWQHYVRGDWDGFAVAFRAVHDSDGSSQTKLQEDPGGTPADITNSNITGSNQVWGGSDLTMPGATEDIDSYIVSFGTAVCATKMVALITTVTGETIQASVSDGFKASDTSARTKIINAIASDSIKGTDTGGNIAQLMASLSDGSKFSDTPSTIAQLLASLSDGAKFSDTSSISLVVEALASDGVELSDVPTVQAILLTLASDGIKLSDATLVMATLLALSADGIDLSDVPDTIATLLALAQDAVKHSDSPSAIASLLTLAQDGIKLSDTGAVILAVLASVQDGTKFSDVSSVLANYKATAQDTVKFSDVGAAVASLLASLSDGVKFSDLASVIIAIFADISDGIKFSDTAEALKVLQALAQESVKLSDTGSTVANLFSQSADGVKFSELVSRIATYLISTSDAAKFSDIDSALASLLAAASDGIKHSDISSAVAALLALSTDGAKLSDNTLAFLNMLVETSDGVKFSESVAGQVAAAGLIFASASDIVKLSDSDTGILTFQVSVSDSVRISDLSLAVMTLLSTALDGVKFSDSPSYPIRIDSISFDLKSRTVTFSIKVRDAGFSENRRTITFH